MLIHSITKQMKKVKFNKKEKLYLQKGRWYAAKLDNLQVICFSPYRDRESNKILLRTETGSIQLPSKIIPRILEISLINNSFFQKNVVRY